NDQGLVYHVAMDHLAVASKPNRSTIKQVLGHISKKLMNGTLYVERTIDVLGAAGTESLPDLLNAIDAPGTSIDQKEVILAGIGQMGKKFFSIAPSLGRMLPPPREPYLKAFLSATLVCVEEDSIDNLTAMKKYLDDPEASVAIYTAVLYINV